MQKRSKNVVSNTLVSKKNTRFVRKNKCNAKDAQSELWYDVNDALDCWDLPVFRRRNPETLNCASPQVFILEVIYISKRYWILFIIMYAGQIGIPKRRVVVLACPSLRRVGKEHPETLFGDVEKLFLQVFGKFVGRAMGTPRKSWCLELVTPWCIL
jgi:hypothetical protein